MEARLTERRTLTVTQGGEQLGELVYKNTFFQRAEIKLTNSEKFEIAPEGFWGTSIIVRNSKIKNELERANCYFNSRKPGIVVKIKRCFSG